MAIARRVKELIARRELAAAEVECERLAEADPLAADELRRRIEVVASERPDLAVPEAYHKWFYDNLVWKHRTWAGVPTYKSPLDLWSYQEIITALRPELIIEFGAFAGGSALYFADILQSLAITGGRVVSIDISLAQVHPRARGRTNIRFIECSSTSAFVQSILLRERRGARRAFAILDSDHSKRHVYDEMASLRTVLLPGDYLIVEDGNINGHPVLPGWGDGPLEAITAYVADHPDDYTFDTKRELTFGWSFAPKGFLIRN